MDELSGGAAYNTSFFSTLSTAPTSELYSSDAPFPLCSLAPWPTDQRTTSSNMAVAVEVATTALLPGIPCDKSIHRLMILLATIPTRLRPSAIKATTTRINNLLLLATPMLLLLR